MDIHIRLEQGKDHRIVEELTREAFWNLYVPGATEHYIVHSLRKSPAFVRDLDFVAEVDGRVAGNIVYSRSMVIDEDEVEHEVLTFGPISVLPEYQKLGIGRALILHSLQAAAEMDFPAVVIYGDPEYYQKKLGFVNGKEYGISAADGRFMQALHVWELHKGDLSHISGRFVESDLFVPKEADFEAFEKTFPYKEKLVTESQKWFAKMVNATV